MRRWPYLLVALLYLLPQVGAFAHEAEALAPCDACETGRGPALECSGDDCEEPGHHHHDHTHHHPGGCRTCSSAQLLAVETLSVDLTWTSTAFVAADVAPSSCAARSLGRSIRAPPATSPVAA
jgi:hypothetical protein